MPRQQTSLTTDNIELCFKHSPRLKNKVQELLVNRDWEALEELLRVESLEANDRARFLSLMYAEVSTKTLKEDLVIDDIYEEP